MEDSFYCVCDLDIKISGINFNKNQIYCFEDAYIFIEFYYQVSDMNGVVLGYICEYDMDSYFTKVMGDINKIDKMFNKIMDEWN